MKTHIFTTFDKKTYHITAAEHQRLERLGDKDFFVLSSGSQIRGSSINAIMTLEDYYQQNPELRPQTNKLLEYKEPISLDSQIEKSEKRFSGLLSGMYLFAEKGMTPNLKKNLEIKKKEYYRLFGKDYIFDQGEKLRARKAINQ